MLGNHGNLPLFISFPAGHVDMVCLEQTSSRYRMGLSKCLAANRSMCPALYELLYTRYGGALPDPSSR